MNKKTQADINLRHPRKEKKHQYLSSLAKATNISRPLRMVLRDKLTHYRKTFDSIKSVKKTNKYKNILKFQNGRLQQVVLEEEVDKRCLYRDEGQGFQGLSGRTAMMQVFLGKRTGNPNPSESSPSVKYLNWGTHFKYGPYGHP